MTEFPVQLERNVRVESPKQVYQALAALLQKQGYAIHETEPPPADEATGRFRGGFRAVRDSVLDADRRRQGYMMIAAGVLITVLMLAVYVTESITNRFLASAPLLPAVLLGGFGLSRLQAPAQRVRRVVDTRFEPSDEDGALRLTVSAGVGVAEGEDSVGDWLDEGEQESLDSVPLDALLARFQAA